MEPHSKQSSKNKFYRAKTFNLIELLVVISLLMILMSLLSPSLNKIIDSSKSLRCSNNLLRIYAGMTSYIDDNAFYLPGPVGATRPQFGNDPSVLNTNMAKFLAVYFDLAKDGNKSYIPEFMCPVNTENDLLKRAPIARSHFYTALRISHSEEVTTFTVSDLISQKVVVTGIDDSTRPFGTPILSNKNKLVDGKMPMKIFQVQASKDKALYDAFSISAIEENEQGEKTLYPGYPPHFNNEINILYLDGHIDRFLPDLVDMVENNKDIQKMF